MSPFKMNKNKIIGPTVSDLTTVTLRKDGTNIAQMLEEIFSLAAKAADRVGETDTQSTMDP